MLDKKEFGNFIVEDKNLATTSDGSSLLVVAGKKIGVPSHRITLASEKKLMITASKIIRHEKNKTIEFEVVRTNYISRNNELRLHTENILYPGSYEIHLKYRS